MQNYLNYLLADMRNLAAAPLEPRKYVNDSGIDDPDGVLDGVMEYMQAPENSMAAIFGLRKEEFPPAEKLSDAQIDELVAAFGQLWGAFHFMFSFPKKATARTRYEFFVKYLDHKTVHATHPNAMIGIEFCDYNTEQCPFGKEICSCLESYERYKNYNPQESSFELDSSDDDEDLPY